MVSTYCLELSYLSWARWRPPVNQSSISQSVYSVTHHRTYPPVDPCVHASAYLSYVYPFIYLSIHLSIQPSKQYHPTTTSWLGSSLPWVINDRQFGFLITGERGHELPWREAVSSSLSLLKMVLTGPTAPLIITIIINRHHYYHHYCHSPLLSVTIITITIGTYHYHHIISHH